MRFGQDSVAFLKPEENGGLMETGGGSESEGDQGSMIVYDYVDSNKIENATKKP